MTVKEFSREVREKYLETVIALINAKREQSLNLHEWLQVAQAQTVNGQENPAAFPPYVDMGSVYLYLNVLMNLPGKDLVSLEYRYRQQLEILQAPNEEEDTHGPD